MLNQSVLQRAILATVLAIFNVSVVANIELPEDEKPEKKIEALRVCADPGNMPMSNDKGEGYANRIAKIIADGLGTHVTYFYRPYLNRGLTLSLIHIF